MDAPKMMLIRWSYVPNHSIDSQQEDGQEILVHYSNSPDNIRWLRSSFQWVFGLNIHSRPHKLKGMDLFITKYLLRMCLFDKGILHSWKYSSLQWRDQFCIVTPFIENQNFLHRKKINFSFFIYFCKKNKLQNWTL